MDQRTLGRTHRTVSAIGLGTWQLGADWGEVSEEQALDVLAAAVDAGATTVVVGLGGSGTNDGGAGLLHALGATADGRLDVDMVHSVASSSSTRPQLRAFPTAGLNSPDGDGTFVLDPEEWDEIGVITPAVADMVDLARAAGAVGRVSGAGGGDSVLAALYFYDPASAAAYNDLWSEQESELARGALPAVEVRVPSGVCSVEL